MGKFNMYVRAVFYVTDLASWKRRVKRVAFIQTLFIALFIYSFFVPIGNEANRPMLIITSLLLAVGWLFTLLLIWLNKPTEKGYRIDH